MADRRRSIKDDLKDIEEIRQRLYKNQGRDSTKEGGDKSGPKAMKATDTAKNFKGGGYTPKTKVDGSKYQGAPISKANLQEYKDAQNKKEDKPKRRPGAGREDAMNRYMEERKRKKEGGSRVIG